MYTEEQQPTKQERRELRHQEKIKARQQRKSKRMHRRITLWSLVILAVGGAVFGMVNVASQEPSNNGLTTSLERPLAENDWAKGSEESAVTLIEYSDFQCPACGNYYPIVKQLNQEFGDRIQFIYRHFPLKQIHQNAEIAARTSEAAGRQGKFWEMHDMIFENQKGWSNQRNVEETFISYAEQLNLDIEQFKIDLNSKEVKDKVENDYQGGIQSGVNATPTFFLNGSKLQNPRSYEQFSNIIIQAIENSP